MFITANLWVQDASYERAKLACETSLQNLGLAYLDLYLIHRPLGGIFTARGGLWRNCWTRVKSRPSAYPMLERDTENRFPVLEELHIGLVTRCPLAKGFLTAAYDKHSTFPEGDWRGRMELFTEGGIQKRQAVLDLIQSKAREKNAMPAQISLAWLMGKKPWIVPIPGTRKMERMIENGGAAEVHLTKGEIAEIDRALDQLGGIGMV